MSRTAGARTKKYNLPPSPIKPTPVKKHRLKSEADASPTRTCSCCGKTLSLRYFYKSYGEMNDGFSPLCRDCIVSCSLDPETDEVDADRLHAVIRRTDKPWEPMLLDSAIKEYDKNPKKDATFRDRSAAIVQKVFRMLNALPQYKMSYADYENKKALENDKKVANEFYDHQKTQMAIEQAEFEREQINRKREIERKLRPVEDPVFLDDDDEEEITYEIIRRWGDGWTESQYKAFERKRKFLSQSYSDYSALHAEALYNYVRYQVLAEEALRIGDIDKATSFSSLAAKAAASAKLNPSQIKDDQETSQFSFSEFAASVERAADVIQIMPRFKYEALDSVDFCIYAIAQWTCGVLGKPCSSYEDIYKFYDDAKDEYIEQYGDPYHIFDDDPTESNRDRVEKFIQVPEDSLANFETNDV